MKSENKYIGDDKFKKFLEHYECHMPLEIIKMRFIGAICSPNADLRPTDVIASFWENNSSPRLETKKEAELFFKFFMGLWDEMFSLVSLNKITFNKISLNDDLKLICQNRSEQIEYGFIEGFWGGKEDAKLPVYIAEVVDSLSNLADTYQILANKTVSSENNDIIFKNIIECDKMVIKSIQFIIENYTLPRINELKRVVN